LSEQLARAENSFLKNQISSLSTEQLKQTLLGSAAKVRQWVRNFKMGY
jgi:hypothetical protein